MDWNRLPIDVRLELSDPLYLNRTHGKKSTYQDKCRGPLCRKNERDIKRKQYAARIGGSPSPRRARVARARDALLELIQAWHEAERDREREARREARAS